MHALKMVPYRMFDSTGDPFWRTRDIIAHDKNKSNQHNFMLYIWSLTIEIIKTIVKCYQNPVKMIEEMFGYNTFGSFSLHL